MNSRELEPDAGTKSRPLRRAMKRQTKEAEAQEPLWSQHDPLARMTCRRGDAQSASAHASLLNRATTSQPSRAQPSLLQLQRQYGNRYVQRVLALARKTDGDAETSPEVEQAIQQSRSRGLTLDRGVQTQMEPAFGADFSGVRVHTDSKADTLSRTLSARAFTTGQDIFFRHGEYNPGSSSGRELLAHELTHVVQQNDTEILRKLAIGQPGDRYEQEADQIAQAIMQQEQQASPTEVDQRLVRRQVEEEEEEPVQAKVEEVLIQRQEEEEEEPI